MIRFAIFTSYKLIVALEQNKNEPAMSITAHLTYFWHSISATHLPVELVQVKRNVVCVVCHGNSETRRPVLFHEVLKSVEELLALRFVPQLVLLGVGEVSARAGTVLYVILRELGGGARQLGCSRDVGGDPARWK